jgi:hypothetical protein
MAFMARGTQPPGQVMPSTLMVTIVIDAETGASSVLEVVELGLAAFFAEFPS